MLELFEELILNLRCYIALFWQYDCFALLREAKEKREKLQEQNSHTALIFRIALLYPKVIISYLFAIKLNKYISIRAGAFHRASIHHNGIATKCSVTRKNFPNHFAIPLRFGKPITTG